jgi:hypothetical protein
MLKGTKVLSEANIRREQDYTLEIRKTHKDLIPYLKVA